MVKIERTYPAPPSLAIEAGKRSGQYNKSDVVKQLFEDAHGKCYICEMKDLQDPVVEHLLPHKEGKYPERKFDWDNLFWRVAIVIVLRTSKSMMRVLLIAANRIRKY